MGADLRAGVSIEEPGNSECMYQKSETGHCETELQESRVGGMPDALVIEARAGTSTGNEGVNPGVTPEFNTE
jgi:hypothetical protein